MMRNVMEYKGYHTKIEFDAESMILRGKIEGINDYVDFEAEDSSKIVDEFHAAVDDYLEFCKEVGKEPEKEYKGTFNVRIAPELHKKLALRALQDGQSLNAEVEEAIRIFVEEEQLQSPVLVEEAKETVETMSMNKVSYENETKIYRDENVIPFANIKHTYREDEVKSL